MLDRLNLRDHAGLTDAAWNALIAVGAAAIGVAIALLAHRLVYMALLRLSRASESKVDDIVAAHLRKPTRWAMVALGLILAARETPVLADVWQKIAGFVMPALIGWIVVAVFRAFVEAACLDDPNTTLDDVRARRRRTRLAIVSRIVTFVVVFVTIGLMLLSIPGVREIGVTLMASAGIAALAVGAAAQPALKSLIAGIQMAVTEPISIGDVVMIGGDGGTVEDIRSSFVIVRTWDERRLVVPTSKFLDETFENWSRNGSALTGPAFLHLDPAADIPPIRAEFERLVEDHSRWDQRKRALQVTNMAPGSIEIRAVVSAASPGDLFELRADIREALLAWIRVHQPEALAHTRQFEPTPEPGIPNVTA
ncbi:MAG: hypothetical protein B7Z08_10980 [Sphingomonadales bacterium 32-68-7]|nr:MAG: hypothetical protein B7Z33_09680 [Sphingomonadales bacterium 12-68-11]OYX08069.1 MAG: hypothetical protein B7Z08_10980 [Sphingomonadales bacterium 32-68-7]